MVLAFKTLVELWRERLAELDARAQAGQEAGWYAIVERRVLAYLVRRHEADGLSKSAVPLDEASAEDSERLKLDVDVRRRLEPVWPETAGGRRGFRSEEDLAALDAEVYRGLEFRRRMAARASFCVMAFLALVTFVVSAYVIIVVLGLGS